MTEISNAVNSTQIEYNFTGIDCLTVAVTPIFTTLSGTQRFYVSQILLNIESITGVAAGNCVFSMGYNFPNYDNVNIPDTLPGTFDTDGKYFYGSQQAITDPLSLPPATLISFNLQVADATATTFVVGGKIIGNYI